MFTNLIELIKSMPDEQTCRNYIAEQRWGKDRVVCPYCNNEKAYVIEGGKRYKCASKACYKKFSVTVGTIMEASNIPLVKWLTGIYLVSSHKKGISSYQLGRDLGIAQKNSWFMLHRIREMLRCKETVVLGENNPVEADEMFVGGSISNKHNSKRKLFAANPDQFNNKTTVLGMVERKGKLIAEAVSRNKPSEIVAIVAATLSKDATLITDTTNLYNKLNSDFTHHSVNHSANEYIRGDIHTNTIEGAFSHFKRMVYGIYHQISPKHTQRYLDEFTYRYNNRKLKDADRFTLSLQSIKGRLTYKALIATETEPFIPADQEGTFNRGKGILQIKDGEIIAHFLTLGSATRTTGVHNRSIRNVCKGIKKSAGGFTWKYA